MIIVHSENSTAQPEWHPNAVQRGTWAIYQTCVITIILCVWTTIHLNVPRPGEKSSKQIWRRIGWSLLTIIAPEVVALNAWLQYRNAKTLLATVNEKRPPTEPYFRHCLNAIAFACFIPVRLLDWVRISRFGRFLVKQGLVHDRSWSDCRHELAFAQDSALRREARIKAKMENPNLTWTMSMAFYALSGGCVYTSKTGEQRILRRDAIVYLALHEPQSLLQLQRVVLQNPGKANATGKAITCVQAFWFCSQCIARLSGNLAVSLLELNTFAHCISALLIYVFWWDKLYDVEVLTFVESKALDFCFLIELSFSSHKILMEPFIYQPHGSGRADGLRGTYCISDSQGNRLICGSPRIRPFVHIRDPDNSRYLRADRGSITRLFDTGLYLSFESSNSLLDNMYISKIPQAKTGWGKLWSAWVESGRPLPPKPITQTETWFYRRTAGSPDLDADLVDQIRYQLSPAISVIMTLTFIVNGGLHLLAWQYNFKSRSERYLWRISAVTTASTGLLLLTLYLAETSRIKVILSENVDEALSGITKAEARFYHWAGEGLRWSSYLLAMFNVACRAFLIIESFIALPNSPRSTYTIPSWTAYIPHI